MRRYVLAALIALTAPLASQAQEDRYEGYYHPPITSKEVFDREINNPPPASREIRIAFVTEITRAQLAAPEAPQYVLFAKGTDADKLFLVATEDDVFRTLYRARAVLAQLTSNSRGTEFFQKNGLATVATFFDLLKMLDFEVLTISDGVEWAHQIEFR